MYQLLILLPLDVDINAFDEGWPKFLRLAEKLQGLQKETISRIDRGIYGHNQIQRIYSFIFNDKYAFEKALTSPEGEQAGKLIHQISGGKVILLSSHYLEDSLDNILNSNFEGKE
jgi:hypothetical protein